VATVSFSTVLPAVLGTYELLAAYPRLAAGLRSSVPVRVPWREEAAFVGLAASAVGLAGVGVWPDYLYPLLWLSPLVMLVSLQALNRQGTVFAGLRHGDWRRVVLLGLAALVCGLFWEMWNVNSAAKWVYEVPFVGRFHLFEMPALGFAGYLPFGLECAAIADLLRPTTGAQNQAGLGRLP